MTPKKLHEKEEGFTLIELLVVIIIIGILAAIAIPTFLNQREKGWESAAKSALKSAAIAQESYFTENNAYSTAVGTTSPKTLLVAEGYNPSADVTLAVTATTTATRYCLSAFHVAAPTAIWYLSSDSGAMSTTAC